MRVSPSETYVLPFVVTVPSHLTPQVDDISTIFDVEEKVYHPGSVSWGSSGGHYYLHRVDRQGYAKIKERFESLHGTSTRSTRSRK
jgi:H3 lysine-79-specific histone-lysine N-methyltransferase